MQLKSSEFSISNPVRQHVTGESGTYTVYNEVINATNLSKFKTNFEKNDAFAMKMGFNKAEQFFWKNIKQNPPVYGSDCPGSFFTKECKRFNLNCLNTVMSKGINVSIPGVTSPYIYFGNWKTLFPWHKEDLDLYSINFHHYGRPKVWYGIATEDQDKFDSLAQKLFPTQFKNCPEFLRHKMFIIHPSLVMAHGIRIHRCIQSQSEFVITFKGSYHAGFNLGFNIAEATNFATSSWIDLGKKAEICNCIKDSVRINCDDYIKNVQMHDRNPLLKLIKQSNKSFVEPQPTKQLTRNKRKNVPIASNNRIENYFTKKISRQEKEIAQENDSVLKCPVIDISIDSQCSTKGFSEIGVMSINNGSSAVSYKGLI